MSLKLVLSLFTRSNITLFLSILGSVGAISSWFYTFYKNHKHFSVEIVSYRPSSFGLLLYIQFSNYSELPLSINEIAVLHNKHEYICKKNPSKVLEKVNQKGCNTITYYSMKFPINLPPLCGDSGYLFFSVEKDGFPLEAKEVTLIIRTNRGREVQKTLPLENLLGWHISPLILASHSYF